MYSEALAMQLLDDETLALLSVLLFALLFLGLGFVAGYLYGHSAGSYEAVGKAPKRPDRRRPGA